MTNAYLYRGPAFQIVTLDLTAAGSETFFAQAQQVTFVRAVDSSGVLALSALVNVKLGIASPQIIPASVNTLVKLQNPVNAVVFSWAAQPGVTATFMVSPDEQVMVHAPPAEQLVTTSIGTTLATTAATVGTSAVQIAPASLRQSLVIVNNGGSAIYVGGSGVTAATGVPVPANGGVLVLDKTTAAVYAVAASGSNDVRVMTEA